MPSLKRSTILTITAFVVCQMPLPVRAAAPTGVAAAICSTRFSGVFGLPNSEPLGACQLGHVPCDH